MTTNQHTEQSERARLIKGLRDLRDTDFDDIFVKAANMLEMDTGWKRAAEAAALLAADKADQRPISDVTEAVTRTVIEVEKILCEKLGKKWSQSGMSIETLVNELAEGKAGGERSISLMALSKMFLELEGYDKNQPGYQWRTGWNDALRQAMDYAQPQAEAVRVPEGYAVGLRAGREVPDGVEPLFYVRLLPDGMYEGPIHRNVREYYDGDWTPLYTKP